MLLITGGTPGRQPIMTNNTLIQETKRTNTPSMEAQSHKPTPYSTNTEHPIQEPITPRKTILEVEKPTRRTKPRDLTEPPNQSHQGKHPTHTKPPNTEHPQNTPKHAKTRPRHPTPHKENTHTTHQQPNHTHTHHTRKPPPEPLKPQNPQPTLTRNQNTPPSHAPKPRPHPQNHPERTIAAGRPIMKPSISASSIPNRTNAGRWNTPEPSSRHMSEWVVEA